MDPSFVDSLLHEAQMLGRYAARAGKLPADSRLFDEIESIMLSRQRGESASVAPLIAEMMNVSKAAKVTVAQLMRRETTRL